MAKRTTNGTNQKPDQTDKTLIHLASTVLSDYFMYEGNEEKFRALSSHIRTVSHEERRDVDEAVFELASGPCTVVIRALAQAFGVELAIRQGSLNVTIDGVWQRERQTLRKANVVARAGSAAKLNRLSVELIEILEASDLEPTEFEELINMVAGEGDSLLARPSTDPLIGDDPKEPPAPTATDRGRIRAIARRLAQDLDGEPSIEDQTWLEQMPQVLPTITDLAVEAAGAADEKRDDRIVQAYIILLAHQLEFVRYRADAGWDWAVRLLDEYQHRLIALGESGGIPQDDWFAMGAVLTEARVAVSDAVQTALADAVYRQQDLELPDDMLGTLRTFLDQLAEMVSSPSEVIESLKNSSALMPSSLRSFLTTELSLSPHAVLRDAVPLMLLDSDSAVRRDAALALEQSARPDRLSSDGLRRTIIARNWVPAADRPALDTAIRKARLAGVEIGGWPAPSPAIEFHATMIDGSGAQSILAVDRSGKKGLFAGLLLKHGDGVAEAWGDADVPKRQITSMMRDAQLEGIFAQVGKPYVDTMVQHAIGTAVEAGRTPTDGLLTIAELIGGMDWKDRKLDIAAEAAALWQDLPEPDRAPDAVREAYRRGLVWMTKDPIIGSWFEDGPRVREALARVPRKDRAKMAAIVMSEVLPVTRNQWTERFLLMAMWCEAAIDPKYRNRARDLIPVAYALAGDAPLDSIPVMGVIATQTIQAVLSGAW